jgi:hypothetical protein
MILCVTGAPTKDALQNTSDTSRIWLGKRRFRGTPFFSKNFMVFWLGCRWMLLFCNDVGMFGLGISETSTCPQSVPGVVPQNLGRLNYIGEHFPGMLWGKTWGHIVGQAFGTNLNEPRKTLGCLHPPRASIRSASIRNETRGGVPKNAIFRVRAGAPPSLEMRRARSALNFGGVNAF